MSTLNGQPIKDTYPGLIKTTDNAAIDGTLKALEDGAGNTLPIEVSATGINFTGTVTGVPAGDQGPQGPQGPIGPIGDQGFQGPEGPIGITGDQGFQGPEGPIGITGPQGAAGTDGTDGVVQSIVAGTGVTVDNTDPANPIVNAAGGAAGLISGGTGLGSMKNADDLVAIAAETLGTNDLVIGSGAKATFVTPTNLYYTGRNIVIGEGAIARKTVDYSFITRSGSAVIIGAGATGNMGGNNSQVVIGDRATGGLTSTDSNVAIGQTCISDAGASVAIGGASEARVSQSIAIGSNTRCSSGYGGVVVGGGGVASGGGFGTGSAALGNYSSAQNGGSVGLGANAFANMQNSIAIGQAAKIPAGTTTGAIVIGQGSGISAVNQRVILIGGGTTLANTFSGNDTVIIGSSTQRDAVDCSNSVQIGLLSKIGASNVVAIGREAYASADGAVALGANVTANRADTVSVKEIEMQTIGGGIIFTSPNGTAWKMTISDTGVPVYTLA